MSSTLTDAEIASVEWKTFAYGVFIIPIGQLIGVFLCFRIPEGRPKGSFFHYTDFAIAIFLALLVVPRGIFELIVYLGIPKILTFGVQIGKIRPSSCEASMALDGPDGTPCTTKRLLEWIGQCLSDGNDCRSEAVPETARKLVVIVLLWTCLSLFTIVCSRTRRLEAEKRKMEESSKNEKV